MEEATQLIDNLLQKSIQGKELTYLGIKKDQQHYSCYEQNPYNQTFSFLESLPQNISCRIFSKSVLKDYYRTNYYVNHYQTIKNSFEQAITTSIKQDETFALKSNLTQMHHSCFDQVIQDNKKHIPKNSPLTEIIDNHISTTHRERIFSEFKRSNNAQMSR